MRSIDTLQYTCAGSPLIFYSPAIGILGGYFGGKGGEKELATSPHVPIPCVCVLYLSDTFPTRKSIRAPTFVSNVTIFAFLAFVAILPIIAELVLAKRKTRRHSDDHDDASGSKVVSHDEITRIFLSDLVLLLNHNKDNRR